MNSGFSSSRTPFYAVAWWRGETLRERGTAEANWIDGDRWWVARVIVQPASERGKGIGSRMLKLLVTAPTTKVVGFHEP